MKKIFFTSTLFFLPPTVALLCNSSDPSTFATYPEIPYYLRQLQQTELEGERVKYNKIIHEAVVNADLSNPKVVKKMEPIIQKIQMAADSGLDRPYLEGTSMWLMSAIDYFEREKKRRVVDIPESDWMPNQTESLNGLRISTYPDKIILHEGQNNRTIVESADIHEAVISPTGKKVAFSRRTSNESRSEIWIVDVRKPKRKKITSIPSCHTLLFSMKGNRLFLQEQPPGPKQDAVFYSISTGGGKPRILGKIRLLESLVLRGPYKGNLIVYKNEIHHLGTTQQECAYAIKENGKEVGKLKNGFCR